jgi:hypothetical protein
MRTECIIHHHLGLGDHFVCNGLVNVLSDTYQKIYLACKKNNFNTVNTLYSENNKIKIFSIEDENKEIEYFSKLLDLPIIRIGFEQCRRTEWNISFYEQFNINFSNRYERFELPNHIPYEEEVYKFFGKNDYCLVHRESSEGKYTLNINTDLPIVEIEKSTDPYKNLLSYRKLIKNANEIHCVNSSVFHLVDSIGPTSKLIYHDVRTLDFKIDTSKWSIIKYD